MNLEHIGLNVPDPVGAAEWYCSNLAMKIVRQSGPPVFARFLADARGQMMLEFYCNSAAPVPDYRSLNPLVLHIAFQVDDVAAVRAKLLQAGATAEGGLSVSDQGDELAMLRDPWGLAIQLVKRAKRMV